VFKVGEVLLSGMLASYKAMKRGRPDAKTVKVLISTYV
jgi:hypothetical protein